MTVKIKKEITITFDGKDIHRLQTVCLWASIWHSSQKRAAMVEDDAFSELERAEEPAILDMMNRVRKA